MWNKNIASSLSRLFSSLLSCYKMFLQRLAADPDWGRVNNSGEEPVYLSGRGLFHRPGTCHKLFNCSGPRESLILQPHSCHLQHGPWGRAGASGSVCLSQSGETACRGGDGLGRCGNWEGGGGARAGPGVRGGRGGRVGLFHAVWWRRTGATQHDGIPCGRWDVQPAVATQSGSVPSTPPTQQRKSRIQWGFQHWRLSPQARGGPGTDRPLCRGRG